MKDLFIKRVIHQLYIVVEIVLDIVNVLRVLYFFNIIVMEPHDIRVLDRWVDDHLLYRFFKNPRIYELNNLHCKLLFIFLHFHHFSKTTLSQSVQNFEFITVALLYIMVLHQITLNDLRIRLLTCLKKQQQTSFPLRFIIFQKLTDKLSYSLAHQIVDIVYELIKIFSYLFVDGLDVTVLQNNLTEHQTNTIDVAFEHIKFRVSIFVDKLSFKFWRIVIQRTIELIDLYSRSLVIFQFADIGEITQLIDIVIILFKN